MLSFVEGNAITLLETGGDFFPALQQAIDEAHHEIYLETYIFQDDATGRGIANALAHAARRGVAVRLLVDGFGSRALVAGVLFAMMQHEGVQVLVYRRELKLFSLRRHRLRRLHRKLAVVDGRVAFVGGINIVDDVEPAGPPFPRFDYAVRVEGPLVAQVHRTVQHVWWLVSWASLRRRHPAPRMRGSPPPQGAVRAAFVIRDNFRHRHDIEDAYLYMLRHAEEEVLIACAYFFPGRRFRHALRAAAERGVRITLLLQGVSDHPVLFYATRALYPTLQTYGIRLYEYRRTYLHAKVAVMDRRLATVGSSNIDPFSLLLAREANVVVDDRTFAEQLQHSLESALEEGAVALCEAEWRRLPVFRRVLSWLAYQFARLAIGLAGQRWRH